MKGGNTIESEQAGTYLILNDGGIWSILRDHELVNSVMRLALVSYTHGAGAGLDVAAKKGKLTLRRIESRLSAHIQSLLY
jgi:hypothetical protein